MRSKWFRKVVTNSVITAIRNGLVMIIPILMTGSFALIFRSFPVIPYQNFITSFAGGFIYNIFSFLYNATFGMLSVYMSVAVGYTFGVRKGNDYAGIKLGYSFVSLFSFLISVGFLTDAFQLSSLSAVGMFTAVICAVSSTYLYSFFFDRLYSMRVYSDGADTSFNRSVCTIFPIVMTGLVFAVINAMIAALTMEGNLWEFTSKMFTLLFRNIGDNFMGAFLYIFLSGILWFFGVHGSDVLESVNVGIFEPAIEKNIETAAVGGVPNIIYTKTFFDVFVLIGGCGTLLSLLIALLLFSRRNNNRVISRLSIIPMVFNINEIMVFGLPIIYNPILLVPFLLAPLASMLISSVGMSVGLVPLTIAKVEWITPIILGGYRATGSVAGSLLQLVNVAVGVLIYMPFVRIYDREKELEARENLDNLTGILREHEEKREKVTLTELNGFAGDTAKMLVNDLKIALEKKPPMMYYQPQYQLDGTLVGAEALLRWNHPSFGIIYPPLVVKLAKESGLLEALEKHVFEQVCSDMKDVTKHITVSINATPEFMCSQSFLPFMEKTFPNAGARNVSICVEMTEQSQLINDEKMVANFAKLRESGFKLAIDDFSMGYTSLKYLSDNHFDTVKLDGSLVRGLDNPRNKDIIASIVYLSQSLGFSVLAEYVETAGQRDMLAAIGCYEYQGYYYSRPLPFEDFQILLGE